MSQQINNIRVNDLLMAACRDEHARLGVARAYMHTYGLAHKHIIENIQNTSAKMHYHELITRFNTSALLIELHDLRRMNLTGEFNDV